MRADAGSFVFLLYFFFFLIMRVPREAPRRICIFQTGAYLYIYMQPWVVLLPVLIRLDCGKVIYIIYLRGDGVILLGCER